MVLQVISSPKMQLFVYFMVISSTAFRDYLYSEAWKPVILLCIISLMRLSLLFDLEMGYVWFHEKLQNSWNGMFHTKCEQMLLSGSSVTNMFSLCCSIQALPIYCSVGSIFTCKNLLVCCVAIGKCNGSFLFKRGAATGICE